MGLFVFFVHCLGRGAFVVVVVSLLGIMISGVKDFVASFLGWSVFGVLLGGTLLPLFLVYCVGMCWLSLAWTYFDAIFRSFVSSVISVADDVAAACMYDAS